MFRSPLQYRRDDRTLPFARQISGNRSFVASVAFSGTCLLLTLLSACGGGGGGESGTIEPVVVPRIDQGRWISATSTPYYTAILRLGAPGQSTVWLLANDASAMARLNLADLERPTGAITGHVYRLADASVSPVAGGFSADPAANPKRLVLDGVTPSALTLTLSTTMPGTAQLPRAAGNWAATTSGTTISWSISGDGLAGYSTTGCSYSGRLVTPSGIDLYEVNFSENCSGSVKVFDGIATLNPESNRLTIVSTSAGQADGAAIFFQRLE
ncbi:MAG: hypothetical protein RIS35_1441 [Pseudomonadota bacterium]|jgi:hypothetical protein